MGGSEGNDIWGWTDAQTQREYALVGQTTGTAFVDVTDPTAPVFLGRLPTATSGSAWRDVKVYQDHAYVVADNAGTHGMQVFDLKRLRGVTSAQTFTADVRYLGFANAHNLAINESTGFAYAVGTNTCNGGLHIVDIRTPDAPTFAGCHSAADTHDTQCVTYAGPDPDHAGREICVSSNENHIAIVDVTDKSATQTIATLSYPELGFTHQGWLTEDHRFFLLGDELDEVQFNLPTRTLVFNVEDLDAPRLAFEYRATTRTIDHNLYVRGNRVFEANYTSGLRLLQFGDLSAGELREIAHFDTFPADNAIAFDGAWSVYPYLPSGTVIVNDITNGLFVLGVDVLTASAGADTSAFERQSVLLEGEASKTIASALWRQTRGTTATITDPTALVTSVTLPNLSASETLTFELTITDSAGGSATDTVDVFVDVYPTAANLPLADAALKQCVVDAEAAGGAADVGDLTRLSCANVASLTGLPALPNVTVLELPSNRLASATQLLAWRWLTRLDLTGNPALPCGDLDALEAAFGSALSIDATCRRYAVVDLGASGFDTAVDEARQRVYVSLPSRNEVAVVSLTTLRLVDRILLPGSPRGIDLSLDGTRLFAALNSSNAVAVIDLDTRGVRTIPLLDQSGDARLWDVVEVRPNRVFVTSNPSSNGFAYVVQIDMDQGERLSRVASERIIRAGPVLVRSSDGLFAYVGEGFSPNSLYKLDLSDPTAPIVLEDQHGTVGGTDSLALNTTGTRIALRSGQVLRTGSFIQAGVVPPGTNAAAAFGNELLVSVADGVLDAYDFDTLALTRTFDTGCRIGGTATQLRVHNQDRNFTMLRDELLCATSIGPRTLPPDPYPALTFTDLALEGCVRAAAQALGLTTATEFTQLDCSGSSLKIRSIEGLEAMTNLSSLDLSGSEVFDLAPLGSLAALTTLSLRNSPLADLSTIAALPALTTLDVTGTENLACDGLNALAADGVSVFADLCREHAQIELGGIGADLALDEPNGRAFVSVPSLRAVLEIDLASLGVVRTLTTSAPPRGIDLSSDGATLYAALQDVGSLGYVDLGSGTEQTVDLATLLDHPSTYDVAEVSPDRIVVSASPGSGGFAYIVEVRRDQGNAAQRVASDRIIRAEPFFAVSNDSSSVYVGEGFSPNSIYKLDASQPDLPIVAEDAHGTINGSRHLSLNASGSLLFTAAGQILETTFISQVGQLPAGLAVAAPSGSTVYVAELGSNAIGVYDSGTLRRIGERALPCALLSITRLAPIADGVIVLGDDLLCATRTVPY